MRKPRDRRKKRDLGRDVEDALGNFTFLWRATLRVPRARAIAALGTLVFVLAMLLARRGTAGARAGAIAAGVLTAAAVAVMLLRERRIWMDPSRIIDRLAGRAMPEQAARAQRALSLLDADGQPADGSVSPVLTRLHVARALAALPGDAIAGEATRVARRFGLAALALTVATIAAISSNPWGVVEGMDIIVARSGAAPVGMPWLDNPVLTARPPDYLHQEERRLRLGDAAQLPRGSVISFRGAPLHAGRKLALYDGVDEVPFVDDGAGKVIARWPLERSAELRVVARFGNVRIEDADTTPVKSLSDLSPVVELEGAPRQLKLVESAAPVEIRYRATDDHGLREVHLVLRSGAREERRVLAKLDGETLSDRGGYVLKASDAFFKKSHAPIAIVVEAKDNDPITGPKWGASAAITAIPPDVGEPETRRLAALRTLRDAYVDATAHVLANALPQLPAARRALTDQEDAEHLKNGLLLDETLSTSYAGVTIAGRVRALLRAQAQKLDEAMRAEVRAPTAATHAALIKATETMTLVVDGVMRGQGLRDARSSAKQLVEVADDLGLGAAQSQRAGEAERGGQRFSAASIVLGGGQRQLAAMGVLGRDLSGAVGAALKRAERAGTAGDWPHAELAARDLAARLRQPDPSFGAKGSGSGHASGESGAAAGGGSDEGGGEAERAFNEAAQDLENLAQEHAGAIGDVERALSQAQSQDDLDALRNDAAEHAKAVREALGAMPSIGTGSDSWTSKGAASKELADQMARSLEQGNPADAVQSGRSALQALDEARRIAQRTRHFEDDARRAGARIEEARRKLEPEVDWAAKQLDELRKKASQRAGGELRKSGAGEEKLADRAGKLSEKAREQGSLPEPAIDALGEAEQLARDAARALERGDAELAMRLQHDAQRQLEAARQALGQDDGQDEADRAREGKAEGDDGAAGRADIPKADAHKGPEEFRRRVVKGLAQPGSARQRDAIKRYAEGLLR